MIAAAIVGGCSASIAPEIPTTPARLNYSMVTSPAWTDQAIERQIAAADRRLGECGIALELQRHDDLGDRVVTVRFVDRIDHPDGLPVEGRITPGSNGDVIEIGWAGPNGEPLDHKQVLAHELGHHLGLGHAPLHAINLMAPHGCELCRFAARQCRQMRTQLATTQ